MDITPNNILTSLDERIKFFSVPVSIAPEKVDFLIGDFFDVLNDPSALEVVYQALHQYFVNNNFDSKLVKDYYFTFWRWYVEATFARFLSLSEDDFLLIFARQLPVAYQLGITVEEIVFYYFFRKFSDEDKLKSFYQKLKKSVLESNTLVHPWVEKSSLLSELIPQYAKVRLAKADSLVMAEYLASIQRILFPPKKEQEFFDEGRKVKITKDFLEFIFFFSQDRDIIATVNNYIDKIIPPKKDIDALRLSPADEKLKASFDTSVPVDRAPLTELSEDIPTSTNPQMEDNTTPPTLAEIKNLVDSEFSKDETGQYADIEAVFGLLDQIAEEYNDEKIKEYFYFDENVGGFVWLEPSN